jgi:small subunit ribosomal protein S2
MARAGQQADAGEKPSYDDSPTGQLATDEPLPAWEQELLAGSADAPAADAPAAEAPAADAAAAEAPAAEAPAAEAPAADAAPTTES